MLNWIAHWLKHRPAPKGHGARKIRLDRLEDRAVPATTLSVNDVSWTEGNGGHKDFVFTVTLSEPSAQNVTVQYATAEGTALDNTDFMRLPNGNQAPPTLTFVPGQTTQTITVRIKGDTTPEADETFFVNLSGAVNATIGDGQGVGTILNDDNSAPVAADQGASTAEDAALTGAVTATDVDGDGLAYAVVAGPAHGTLALNPDGSFTYTPAANYHGSDSFTFTASDGALTSNTATVGITVTAQNDAPVAADQGAITAEDAALTGAVTATDVDGDGLAYAVVAGPAHGTLALNPDGSFTYTPAADYNGTDTFTYRASDGSATSNLATVTLTINPINDAPVAGNDAYSTSEDTPLTVAAGDGVLVGDTDVEGSTLTAILVDDVQHGTLALNPDGSFTYTPAADFNGTDTFTYRADDGSAISNLATVTLTISAVNDAPVAVNDAFATNEDTQLTVGAGDGVLVGDTDVEGSALTAVLVTDVQHGTLSLAADGSFTYTPAANYNGTDTFTYQASDGTRTSDLTTVTLTITAVNDAPVADNVAYATNEDIPLTVAAGDGVLVGDTDVEGSTLTAILVDDVQHGTLTLNSDGSFTYTPAANYNGTDTFTYQASDGTLSSDLTTVTLTITAVNDPPVADNVTYSTNEDTQLTVAPGDGLLVGDTDVEGTTLTAVLVTDVQHGTLSLAADGSFTYTPAANYHGSDSFTYQASDGALTSNLVTVAITVTAGNDAPVLTGGAVLDGVVEADADPLGQTVESIFGGLVNDADTGDSLAGIAVVGTTLNADHGAWQYSTDGGATWFDIGTVGESTALVLAADAMIRFRPALGFSGDPAPLVVRAIDSTFAGPFTDGAIRATVDVATAGGATAFSAATATLQSPVASVSGAWLSDTGNLYVTGTSGDDTIVVRTATPGRVLVVLNGAVIGDFPRTQVTGRLRVRGMDGNDHLKASVRLANPADLYGGLGSDTLVGGSRGDRLFGDGGADRLRGRGGNDVLVGGDGNDTLGGGAGRDVFTGGTGADYLQGSSGSDLLIGGTTDFDLNLTALTAIAAEWASSSSYEDRVAHLTTSSGGQNGTTFFNATNVHDDGVADVLKGWSGRDWFWTADLDQFILGVSEVSGRS